MRPLRNLSLLVLSIGIAEALQPNSGSAQFSDGYYALPVPGVPAQPDSFEQPVISTLPYGTIRTSRVGNITRAVFDNGPINIMDWNMIRDLKTFTDSMKNQSHTKVVVFESANPSFFIAQLSLLSKPGMSPAPASYWYNMKR